MPCRSAFLQIVVNICWIVFSIKYFRTASSHLKFQTDQPASDGIKTCTTIDGINTTVLASPELAGAFFALCFFCRYSLRGIKLSIVKLVIRNGMRTFNCGVESTAFVGFNQTCDRQASMAY